MLNISTLMLDRVYREGLQLRSTWLTPTNSVHRRIFPPNINRLRWHAFFPYAKWLKEETGYQYTLPRLSVSWQSCWHLLTLSIAGLNEQKEGLSFYIGLIACKCLRKKTQAQNSGFFPFFTLNISTRMLDRVYREGLQLRSTWLTPTSSVHRRIFPPHINHFR